MKTEITRQDAVSWIADRFKLPEWKTGETKPLGKLSFYGRKPDGSATFFFDKREVARSKVIEVLQDYFKTRCLPAGDACTVDGITVLFTVVKIGSIHQE